MFPVKTRLGEDVCVFKWNTINLTPSGGLQSEPTRLCYTFIKLQHGKMSILRLRLRPMSTADLYRSSPASNHTCDRPQPRREQYTETIFCHSCNSDECSQIKPGTWASALLRSQFSRACFFTRIWTPNITIKLGGTSLQSSQLKC